jgi:hypothetical protein
MAAIRHLDEPRAGNAGRHLVGRCGGVSSSCAPTSTSVGQRIDGSKRTRVRARHDRLLLAHEGLRPTSWHIAR